MTRLKFTDKWINSCAVPKSGRIEHSDILCPGLYLRVTCNGTKTFSVLLGQGTLSRHTLGRYPILTLANARRDALELMRRIAEGVQDVARMPVTLAALTDQYVELHLKPNVKGWKNVRASLLQPAMQALLTVDAAAISNADVVAVLDAIVADGKPHGAVNVLKALRALYNWAEARGAVAANPCRNIRPPVRTTQRDRILGDAEIVAVLNACDNVPAPFGDMVRLLLFTGARRNEVAEMRWSELSGNVWTLPADRSKSGRANVLRLPSAAMKVLNRLPRYAEDAFIFTTTDGKRPSSDFNKRKKFLDVASKTSSWTLHDLRRTVRSKLSELGVPWEVARRVVGHSVDQLDAVYDRFSYLEEKGRALVQLADHLQLLREKLLIDRASLRSG
jgi:integrase